MFKKINDEEAREFINKNIDTNYFVEAGAGSGKTTSLVSRLVEMVKQGRPVDKICAITFTKAAANEFLDRFQKKLKEESEKSNLENKQKNYIDKALKDIDMCFMGTIDSFCQMIVSEHLNDAKIPYSSQLVDDKEFDKHLMNLLNKIKSGEIENKEKNLQTKWDRFKTEFYNAEEIFLYNVKKIVDVRNVDFEEVKSFEIDLETLNTKYKKLKINNLDKNNLEFLIVSGSDSISVSSLFASLNSVWGKGQIKEIYKNLNSLKDIKFPVDCNDKFYADDHYKNIFSENKRNDARYHSLNKDIQGRIEEITKQLENYLFYVAYDFIKSTADIIPEYFKEKGILRHFDYLLYLRNLLKDDAASGGKIIQSINERYSYYLIDEFQDTNPLQAEIFFYLTSKSVNGNWKDCNPRKGSLFIVGDPKQSIYRFRNADIKSYNIVKNLFEKKENCECLILSNNYRSGENLKTYFNSTFKKLFEGSGIDYKIIGNSKDNACTGSTEEKCTDLLEKNLFGAYSYESQKKDSDYEIVANIIKDLKGNLYVKVKENKKTLVRKAKYSDIMVITKNKKKQKGYMEAFRKAGIPFVAEGDVPFSECPSLVNLQRIMDFILNPEDKKAIFAVNNLVGLDTKKINECKEYIYSGMSAIAIVMKIIERTQLIENSDKSNLDCLYYSLELIRKKNITDIQEVSKYIKALIDDSKDNDYEKEERCLKVDPNLDAVKIANLHKVKGLEAPIVILTKYGKNRGDRSSILVDYYMDTPKAYPFRISEKNSKGYDSYYNNNDIENKKNESKEQYQYELLRLMYVATTRAMNVLIVADDWEFDSKAPKSIIPAVSINELYDKISSFSLIAGCRTSSYEIKKPSDLDSEKQEKVDSQEESTTKAREENHAALKGTMVHRLMEVIVSSIGIKLDDIDSISRNIVEENGIDEKDAAYNDYVVMLKNVGETMLDKGGYHQVNGVCDNILDTFRNAKEVLSEVPFYYYKDKKMLINGIIDLVYEDEEGWHIIDWKTNADNADLDNHYKSQLDLYSEAFEKISGEKVRDAKIYHIDLIARHPNCELEKLC